MNAYWCVEKTFIVPVKLRKTDTYRFVRIVYFKGNISIVSKDLSYLFVATSSCLVLSTNLRY